MRHICEPCGYGYCNNCCCPRYRFCGCYCHDVKRYQKYGVKRAEWWDKVGQHVGDVNKIVLEFEYERRLYGRQRLTEMLIDSIGANPDEIFLKPLPQPTIPNYDKKGYYDTN